MKKLLQITEVEVHTGTNSTKVLAFCDSACSQLWISENLATKLILKGLPTKLPVHGINSQQVVDTEIVELKMTPVHSGGSCSAFSVKPYVRKTLHVGNDVIDVDYLKTIYPLARVIKFHFGSYAIARSVEVKTTSGNFVRPVVKLAPVLPPPNLPDLV